MIASYFIAISTFSGLLSGGIGVAVWSNYDKPGVTEFVFLSGLALVWFLSYGLSLMLPGQHISLLLEALIWVGKGGVATAWLLFTIRYTGRGSLLSKPVIAGLCLPLIAVFLGILTNEWHHLVWTDFRVHQADTGIFITQYSSTEWLKLFVVHLTVESTLGILLIFELLYSNQVYRRQASMLILGALAPLAVNLPWTVNALSVQAIDLRPAAFAISGLVFAYSLNSEEFLSLIPATQTLGHQLVIQDFEIGVMILDGDHIVDLNAPMQEILDCGSGAVLGCKVQSVLDIKGSANSWPSRQTVDVEVDGRKKSYEVTTSEISSQSGTVFGHIIFFHDVTKRNMQRERIEVLNRLLRHNIRNRMLVIRGNSTAARDRIEDPEIAEILDRSIDSAEELIRISEKATRFQKIDTSQTTEVAHLQSVVRNVTQHFDSFQSDIHFELDIPDRCWVKAPEQHLFLTFRELIENALKHAQTTDPTVTIQASADAEIVRVTVIDNGSGIPENELAAVRTGREQKLDHSTGVGLWLVSWAITMMGGEISVRTDESGTSVTIELPKATLAPAEACAEACP